MSFVYGVGETRDKIREIQMNARNGMMSELINKASHESMYLVSSKMFNDIIKHLPFDNVVEFDNDLKVYTVYNDLVPQFYGEGVTKESAVKNMLNGVIDFSGEYMADPELFSGIFSGIQQFLISALVHNIENREKLKEILRIA